jgi:hypothetical protein
MKAPPISVARHKLRQSKFCSVRAHGHVVHFDACERAYAVLMTGDDLNRVPLVLKQSADDERFLG